VKKVVLLFVAAALSLGLGLLSTGCGSLTPWAARVNGQVVSRKALDTELNTILHNKSYLQAVNASLAQEGAKVEGTGTGTVDSSFAARALTRRILLTLVHQEVQHRHLKVTAADLAQARASVVQDFPDAKTFTSFPKAYQNDVVRTTADVNALQKSLQTGGGNDPALRAYYDAHKDQFTETCVSHILVDAKPVADSLRTQIASGADFAALAKANSKDNQGPTGGSAAKGGDLGCLTDQEASSLDPAFLAAMKALPTGQVSDVVQSQFGFHIIKVTDRRPRSFEESKQQIAQQLNSDASNAFSDLITKLVTKAKIEVNPRYGHFEKGARLGVVAPAPPAVGPTTTSPDQVPGFGGQGTPPSSP
jgi:parvulin-like peptidyl-prolyl isomerase